MNSISLFMNALTSRFEFSGADTDASNGSRHKRALQELYRLRAVFKRELLLRDEVMLQASGQCHSCTIPRWKGRQQITRGTTPEGHLERLLPNVSHVFYGKLVFRKLRISSFSSMCLPISTHNHSFSQRSPPLYSRDQLHSSRSSENGSRYVAVSIDCSC